MLPPTEIARTVANGRKYRIYRRGIDVLLRIGDTDTVQSIDGVGPTDLYYDRIADAIGTQCTSVLLLGCGGGTVARLLRERGSRARIVGVDVDPTVISLARRWMRLDQHVDIVVVADAAKWLRDCAVTFDAVVVDCYVDAVVSANDKNVLALARSVVAPNGVMIVNDYSVERGNDVIVERAPIPAKTS